MPKPQKPPTPQELLFDAVEDLRDALLMRYAKTGQEDYRTAMRALNRAIMRTAFDEIRGTKPEFQKAIAGMQGATAEALVLEKGLQEIAGFLAKVNRIAENLDKAVEIGVSLLAGV